MDRHIHNNHNTARVTVSDKTRTFVISVLVALNVLATVWMFLQWRIAERETRLLEYYIMELDGKLMASGVIKFPESWSARRQQEERKK